MSSKYSSAFDDMLAKNEGEMDALLGRDTKSVLPKTTVAPVPQRRHSKPLAGSTGTVIDGTAGGVAFRLTTK